MPVRQWEVHIAQCRSAMPRRTRNSRTAPHLRKHSADRLASTRSAPAKVGQLSHSVTGVTPAPLCKAFPGAKTPAPTVPSPLPPGASVLRASVAAHASWEPVHTHQPLAGVYTRPAPRRLTPRRPYNSRTEPQAHPGTRRTFHQPRGPPETEAERARSVLPSFECHVTTG